MLARYLLQCVESHSSRLQNAEDPTYILASLIGIIKATWYYTLWHDHSKRLIELVVGSCQKAAELMVGASQEKFRADIFQKIGGDQKYRE